MPGGDDEDPYDEEKDSDFDPDKENPMKGDEDEEDSYLDA
jgi:hypothetical protein